MKPNERVSLQSFFGFSKMPFTKYMWAAKMFDSTSQRELLLSLHNWMEVRGIAVVLGKPGLGKSITLRKFRDELDTRSYQSHYLWNLRTTPRGFFRSLCRMLQIPPSPHFSDMFDASSDVLGKMEEESHKHPLLILDDCDNLSPEVMEYLRLLTNFGMDCEDRLSIILCGTETLQGHLREYRNRAFRQRVTFTHHLRPFSVEDTRAYVEFHLKRAECHTELFTEGAISLLFTVSQGIPRCFNQAAMQALIMAVTHGKERIDDAFVRKHVLENLLKEDTEEDDR